ncbi:MAG: hypothetical protein U9R79_03870 [Armatimonadota bacterium]|nr:hypothetical protein [Armatimonadota bacterium]
MRTVTWRPQDAEVYAEGLDEGLILTRVNLTEHHGEREFLRCGFLVDMDGDRTP